MPLETATELQICPGCGSLIHRGEPVYLVQVPGMLSIYERGYCSPECRREWQDHDERGQDTDWDGMS